MEVKFIIKYHQLKKRFLEMSFGKYIFVMGIVGFVYSIITVNILRYVFYIDPLKGYTEGVVSNFDVVASIISGIFLAPIVETVIFQAIVLEILKKLKICSSLKIGTSAVLFGVAHGIYGIAYAILAFFIGIVLAYSYLIFEEKRERKILGVMYIHSLINVGTILFSATCGFVIMHLMH